MPVTGKITVFRSGNSIRCTIPNEWVKSARLKPGDVLDVVLFDRGPIVLLPHAMMGNEEIDIMIEELGQLIRIVQRNRGEQVESLLY